MWKPGNVTLPNTAASAVTTNGSRPRSNNAPARQPPRTSAKSTKAPNQPATGNSKNRKKSDPVYIEIGTKKSTSNSEMMNFYTPVIGPLYMVDTTGKNSGVKQYPDFSALLGPRKEDITSTLAEDTIPEFIAPEFMDLLLGTSYTFDLFTSNYELPEFTSSEEFLMQFITREPEAPVITPDVLKHLQAASLPELSKIDGVMNHPEIISVTPAQDLINSNVASDIEKKIQSDALKALSTGSSNEDKPGSTNEQAVDEEVARIFELDDDEVVSRNRNALRNLMRIKMLERDLILNALRIHFSQISEFDENDQLTTIKENSIQISKNLSEEIDVLMNYKTIVDSFIDSTNIRNSQARIFQEAVNTVAANLPEGVEPLATLPSNFKEYYSRIHGLGSGSPGGGRKRVTKNEMSEYVAELTNGKLIVDIMSDIDSTLHHHYPGMAGSPSTGENEGDKTISHLVKQQANKLSANDFLPLGIHKRRKVTNFKGVGKSNSSYVPITVGNIYEDEDNPRGVQFRSAVSAVQQRHLLPKHPIERLGILSSTFLASLSLSAAKARTAQMGIGVRYGCLSSDVLKAVFGIGRLSQTEPILGNQRRTLRGEAKKIGAGFEKAIQRPGKTCLIDLLYKTMEIEGEANSTPDFATVHMLEHPDTLRLYHQQFHNSRLVAAATGGDVFGGYDSDPSREFAGATAFIEAPMRLYDFVDDQGKITAAANDSANRIFAQFQEQIEEMEELKEVCLSYIKQMFNFPTETGVEPIDQIEFLDDILEIVEFACGTLQKEVSQLGSNDGGSAADVDVVGVVGNVAKSEEQARMAAKSDNDATANLFEIAMLCAVEVQGFNPPSEATNTPTRYGNLFASVIQTMGEDTPQAPAFTVDWLVCNTLLLAGFSMEFEGYAGDLLDSMEEEIATANRAHLFTNNIRDAKTAQNQDYNGLMRAVVDESGNIVGNADHDIQMNLFKRRMAGTSMQLQGDDRGYDTGFAAMFPDPGDKSSGKKSGTYQSRNYGQYSAPAPGSEDVEAYVPSPIGHEALVGRASGLESMRTQLEDRANTFAKRVGAITGGVAAARHLGTGMGGANNVLRGLEAAQAEAAHYRDQDLDEGLGALTRAIRGSGPTSPYTAASEAAAFFLTRRPGDESIDFSVESSGNPAWSSYLVLSSFMPKPLKLGFSHNIADPNVRRTQIDPMVACKRLYKMFSESALEKEDTIFEKMFKLVRKYQLAASEVAGDKYFNEAGLTLAGGARDLNYMMAVVEMVAGLLNIFAAVDISSASAFSYTGEGAGTHAASLSAYSGNSDYLLQKFLSGNEGISHAVKTFFTWNSGDAAKNASFIRAIRSSLRSPTIGTDLFGLSGDIDQAVTGISRNTNLGIGGQSTISAGAIVDLVLRVQTQEQAKYFLPGLLESIFDSYIDSCRPALSTLKDIFAVANGSDPEPENSQIFSPALVRLLRKPEGRAALRKLSYSQARLARFRLFRAEPYNDAQGTENSAVISKNEKLFLLSCINEIFVDNGDSNILTIGIPQGYLQAMEKQQVGNTGGYGTSDILFYLDMTSEFMRDLVIPEGTAERVGRGAIDEQVEDRREILEKHLYKSMHNKGMAKTQHNLYYGSPIEAGTVGQEIEKFLIGPGDPRVSKSKASIDSSFSDTDEFDKYLYQFDSNTFVTPMSFFSVKEPEIDDEGNQIKQGFWKEPQLDFDQRKITTNSLENYVNRSIEDWSKTIRFFTLDSNGAITGHLGDDFEFWSTGRDTGAFGIPSDDDKQRVTSKRLIPVLRSYAIGRIMSLISDIDFDAFEFDAIDHGSIGSDTREFYSPVYDRATMDIYASLLRTAVAVKGTAEAERMLFFIENLLVPSPNDSNVLIIDDPAEVSKQLTAVPHDLIAGAGSGDNAGKVIGQDFYSELSEIHVQLMCAISRGAHFSSISREKRLILPSKFERVIHMLVPGPRTVKRVMMREHEGLGNPTRQTLYQNESDPGDIFNGIDLRYCLKTIGY